VRYLRFATESMAKMAARMEMQKQITFLTFEEFLEHKKRGSDLFLKSVGPSPAVAPTAEVVPPNDLLAAEERREAQMNETAASPIPQPSIEPTVQEPMMIELLSDPPLEEFGEHRSGCRIRGGSRELDVLAGSCILNRNEREEIKPKKKPMTLDDFAVLIQKDFARMATKDDLKHLATKEELAAIRAEMAGMREEMATKEDLAAVSDRISVAKDELQEQIAGLKYAKEIDELHARVNIVEQKIGIRPSRRAA
jgi:hypothetical protein